MKSTSFKHNMQTFMTSNKTFCYLFGLSTGFIQHGFLFCLDDKESYKCKFELAKLGQHFLHIRLENNYNYQKLSSETNLLISSGKVSELTTERRVSIAKRRVSNVSKLVKQLMYHA